MPEPIKIHIGGHAHETRLPVKFEEDGVAAWLQAFDHALEYLIPYGLSFELFGRGCSVRFHGGLPFKADIDRLCAALIQEASEPASVFSVIPLTPSPHRTTPGRR